MKIHKYWSEDAGLDKTNHIFPEKMVRTLVKNYKAQFYSWEQLDVFFKFSNLAVLSITTKTRYQMREKISNQLYLYIPIQIIKWGISLTYSKD